MIGEKYGRYEWQSHVVKYVWRLKDSYRVLMIICGVISRRGNVETTCVHHLAYANKTRISDVKSLCSNREHREKTRLSAAKFWSVVKCYFKYQTVTRKLLVLTWETAIIFVTLEKTENTCDFNQEKTCYVENLLAWSFEHVCMTW